MATFFTTLDQIKYNPDTPQTRSAKQDRLRRTYSLPENFKLVKGVNVFPCADGMFAWCIAEMVDDELTVTYMNLRRHKDHWCAMRNAMRAKPHHPYVAHQKQEGNNSVPTLCKWN